MSINLDEFNQEWIKNAIDEKAVLFAEKFGEYLCDIQDNRLGRMAMTTSQIRNVFGEVKRIQAKGYSSEKSSFLLLRPKIAYAEARVKAKSGKSRIEDFRKVMDKAHLAVTDEKSFQNFVDFMEATLAYHKAAGGRD
jgi:CRISPR-associated protein Csm2